jgi:hypothetical protein
MPPFPLLPPPTPPISLSFNHLLPPLTPPFHNELSIFLTSFSYAAIDFNSKTTEEFRVRKVALLAHQQQQRREGVGRRPLYHNGQKEEE